MKQVSMPFQSGKIFAEIPEQSDILQMSGAKPLNNCDKKIEEALAEPLGTPPFAEIVRKKAADADEPSAVIVISDNTRPVPYNGEQGILWPLVRILLDEGVKGPNISVLVATGTHRALTGDEVQRMIDPRVLESGAVVVNHDCKDQQHLEFLGQTRRGTNIYIDDRYMKADIRVLTGLVESHFMAGASGGRKAICPGLIGEDSTFIFHGAEMLGDPNSDDLVLEGNPCHEEALEVAQTAGADFIVNVTLDGSLDVTGVFAGELEAAHKAAVEQVKQHVGISIDKEYDIVIAHAGFVGINHYQVAKVGVEAMKVVKPDGAVIIAADNTDGSHPVGAMTYRTSIQLLKVIGSENFLRVINSEDWTFIPEQWQVQMWTKLFRKIPTDHFYYYSPQFTPEHYLMVPGVDGSQLLKNSRLKDKEGGNDAADAADAGNSGDAADAGDAGNFADAAALKNGQEKIGKSDQNDAEKTARNDTQSTAGLDAIPQFIQAAIADAAERLGKPIDQLDICYLQDGPYGIPLKS